MRICLINSPNTNELIGNDPVIIKDQQGTYPPLGLLCIAAYLRQYGYDDIHVIDAQVDNISHAQVAEKVAELKPGIVGLTVMTFTLIDCKLVISEIRKRSKCKIIVGGPHCSIYAEESITGLCADSVVVGEGEETFLEIIKDYPNLKQVYRQKNFIQDLDSLPFPARELTPIEKYYSVLAENTPTSTAFSSRGCPFSCLFCDRPALGKSFRFQSAGRVIDEMQWCQEHGIRELFFYDDTFTVRKDRVYAICAEYKKRGLTIKWDVRARVNTVDENLLKELSECGVTRIHFGVESASPRILKILNKGITQEQVYKAFDACHRLGIKTLAYFMMGNPTETLEDIKENLHMAKIIKADYLQMTILSMFPGTKIYEIAKKEGLVTGDPWLDYVKNPVLGFRPPMWEEIYSRDEHEEHLRWFYKKFYLRPRFILDRLLEIKNTGQFIRYFNAGLSLARMSIVKESKVKSVDKIRESLKETSAVVV